MGLWYRKFGDQRSKTLNYIISPSGRNLLRLAKWKCKPGLAWRRRFLPMAEMIGWRESNNMYCHFDWKEESSTIGKMEMQAGITLAKKISLCGRNDRMEKSQ